MIKKKKEYTDEQAFYGKKQTRRMNVTRIAIQLTLVVLIGASMYGIHYDIQKYENGGTITLPYLAIFIYEWLGEVPLMIFFFIVWLLSALLLITDLKRIFKKKN